MALQTNLSKKDKMTIAVLLFAGAVFMIIWFLIRPTITSITTINDKIEQAEITQTQNKNKIMYLSSGEAVYSKAVDDLNTSTSDYYEIMDSSEIDKMVTSYVLKSGLFSENLTINMPSGSVEEKPYLYSDLSSNNSNTAGAETTTTNNGSDTLLTPYTTARNNSNSTQFSGVQCVGLILVVTGSRSTCQAFIDDLCTKPAVRITDFSWGKVDMIEEYNEETNMVELRDPGTIRLTISLNLYMAEFDDYSTPVSDSAA